MKLSTLLGLLICALLVACSTSNDTQWAELGEPGWRLDWERRGPTKAFLMYTVDSGSGDGSVAFSCNTNRRLDEYLAVSVYLPEAEHAQAVDLGSDASHSLRVKGGGTYVAKAFTTTNDGESGIHILDQKAVSGFVAELLAREGESFSITSKGRQSASPFAQHDYSMGLLPKLGLERLVLACGFDDLVEQDVRSSATDRHPR